MPLLKEPNAEPIPGYRLIERLGSGGFGEVWKCEAPGGLFKAIKFVYGNLNGLDIDKAQAQEEWRAIERIKSIRHPFLLSMDRVESVGGELIIVTELADKNLHELFVQRQQEGHTGIPRPELLAYLREAAEVLDLLNCRYQLQHLDVKPHNLFLVCNHIKVADFGLVSSLGTGTGKDAGTIQLGAITPLYASPELFLGSISRHSDQYSLAVLYQQLLTGQLPFQGKNPRQLLFQHTKCEPDLSPLPETDRSLLARALAKDPEQRFPTCMDFIRALRALTIRGSGSIAVTAVPAPAPANSAGWDVPHNGRSDPDLDVSTHTPPVPPQAEAGLENALITTVRRTSLASTPGPKKAPPLSSCGTLAGWQFTDCLSSSPLVDVWRVQAPDGQYRLVKLVYGAASRDGKRQEEALLRFASLLHPVLTQVEVVHSEPGRLVLVTELIEGTLRDRCQQYRTQKWPGIDRAELLGYLRTAAEVLDYLYQQHAIQHLGLNPRNLLLDGGRLVIAEFGLAQLFWVPAEQPVAERNARYAAPELFERKVSRSCDQYSLAVIYHEMLTGCHVFPSQTSGSAAAGGRKRPVLNQLPADDREVIARALDPDPRRRWPSCTDLVNALEQTQADKADTREAVPDSFSALLSAAAAQPRLSKAADIAATQLAEVIETLVASAGGDVSSAAKQSVPVLAPGEEVLQHKFTAGLPLGAARLKLDAFREQRGGQLVREDEQGYVFRENSPASFWGGWLGQRPGLEVQVGLTRQHILAATPIEVSLLLRPFGCGKKRGAQLLREMGTALLEDLRTALLVNSEKRVQDRLLWPHPLNVRPLRADGTVGEPVTCRGKDISLSGIGFYLPHELSTPEVLIDLPATGKTPAVTVPATLVRAQRSADGWYQVGALFRLAAVRKSVPELSLA